MCCVSQMNIKSKQTTKRFVVLAFLVCFILVSLLAEAFIVTNANHEHDHNGAGGSCATCTQILHSENLLRQLGIAVSSAIFAFGSFLSVAIFSLLITSSVESQSLVGLKIRMNN